MFLNGDSKQRFRISNTAISPPIPQPEAAVWCHTSGVTPPFTSDQLYTSLWGEQTGQPKPGHPPGNYL